MNKIRHQCENFFSKLYEAGVKMYFPIVKMIPDMTIEEYQHWLRSIKKNYRESLEVINKVKEFENLNQLAEIYAEKRHHEFVHPFPHHSAIYSAILEIAEKYGKPIGFEYSGYNFDPLFDVLELVKRYKAYAIIGFNSYYFFYEGPWKYWCSNQLDMNELTIIEYKRENVLNFLGLTYDEIPMFVYLCDFKSFIPKVHYVRIFT